METYTPRQIVTELDKYIVGQHAAKKAVAIAIRNRWRRQQLPGDLREEVAPKNIIMIGPTGVGKTEIARRLALMLKAPFAKVEASKFTEVGYVGRDVESIIRELADVSIALVRREYHETVKEKARFHAEDRILDLLMNQKFPELMAAPGGGNPAKRGGQTQMPNIPFGKAGDFDMAKLGSFIESLTGHNPAQQAASSAPPAPADSGEDDIQSKRERKRAELRQQLHKGELDAWEVELTVTDRGGPNIEVMAGAGLDQMGVDFQSLFDRIIPTKSRQRRMRVPEAIKVIVAQESDKLVDNDKIIDEARRRAEQSGIVFIDEIDKIAGGASDESRGPMVSREGVQRDLLPIIEGCTVNTKCGPVKTDHILFLAAGAFHISSPADLLPELQGRFPIRVELSDLTREDFVRILTEPKNALIRQYQALLKTDGITLDVSPDGIEEIARIAADVNQRQQNIGARRLHTILERLLEDIAFEAPDVGKQTFTLDREAVFLKLAGIIDDDDLSRYVL